MAVGAGAVSRRARSLSRGFSSPGRRPHRVPSLVTSGSGVSELPQSSLPNSHPAESPLFFYERFSPHLSGFRKKYSCQDVLLKFVDTCKVAQVKDQIYGAVLTDLSKAFDCLPYRLAVSKLQAYGVDDKACMLIASYFSNRKQRIKMGDVRRTWSTLRKGAPQGLVLGPFTFNCFQNDLLYSMTRHVDIFNFVLGYSVHDVLSQLKMHVILC